MVEHPDTFKKNKKRSGSLFGLPLFLQRVCLEGGVGNSWMKSVIILP
jgi:hypothetical protein